MHVVLTVRHDPVGYVRMVSDLQLGIHKYLFGPLRTPCHEVAHDYVLLHESNLPLHLFQDVLEHYVSFTSVNIEHLNWVPFNVPCNFTNQDTGTTL